MVDCDSERIWKIVESSRQNVPKRRRQSDSSPTLFDRLYDCYVERSQAGSDKSADKRFRNTVNLLERLSPNHAHPSLIVNLYSDEQGYSLVLSPKKGSETEEFFLPYEDNEIFSYLDNQELPPVLVEVLGQTKYCHMYNGCVVCEVRDHRSFSCSHGNYDRYLLLLRPTTETILSTVEEMAYETGCSAEDKLMLESRLLLATQPPICLDPSTDVVCLTNRLQYNQRKFHTAAVRRALRRRSHARRARMHVTSVGVAPHGLQLHDFITQRAKTQEREKKRDFSSCWKKAKVDYQLEDTPETIFSSILQLAKPVTPPPLFDQPQQPRRPSTTTQPKPRPPPVPRPLPTAATHPLLDERESQSSVPGGVQNEVTQLQGLPPHPTLPQPPHPPHVVPVGQAEHPAHPLHLPPPPHTVTRPPVISPPPTIKSSQASQPHPLVPPQPPPPIPAEAIVLTPAPPRVQPQPTMPPEPANVPTSAPVALTPAPPVSLPQAAGSNQLQTLTHTVTNQQQQSTLINFQLPPGMTASPGLLKMVFSQIQPGRKSPRPIAPADAQGAHTAATAGGAPAVKPKPPASLGKPPPLSQGTPNAVVVVPRSGGSSLVKVSPHVRPPLNPLSVQGPPSLTPPPKRPLLSQPAQNVSPVQGGMPKLHPLSHDTSVKKTTSLPPQPVLSKPFVPAPPPLSTSTTATAPPPSMPTLHKIMTATPTVHQQQQPPQLQPQHKATPIVGGAPPLKLNPNIVMPKLTSSLGQVKPSTSTTGLPVLSRAPVPVPMQPPPPTKPHPQADVSGTGTSNVSGGSSVANSLALLRPSELRVGTPKSSAAMKSKSHKQSGSAGKSGKSSSKKKKK